MPLPHTNQACLKFSRRFNNRGVLDVVSQLTWIRRGPVGDDLSQHNAEAPDVGLDGELGAARSLWSGPLDGELPPRLITGHRSGQSKI